MNDRGRCDGLSMSYVGDSTFLVQVCEICYTWMNCLNGAETPV